MPGEAVDGGASSEGEWMGAGRCARLPGSAARVAAPDQDADHHQQASQADGHGGHAVFAVLSLGWI